MGYRRERKVFKLIFEDPAMDGLVVRTRSASFRQFMNMQAMAGDVAEKDGAAFLKQVTALFGLFLEVVIDWNWEDEAGEPVPKTVDALLDEDFDFAMAMITGWLEHVGGVTAPVGKESTPGSPLLAGSLAMETLSPSPPSSSTPS